MAAGPVQVVIGLTGLEAESGDVNISQEQIFRIAMPASINSRHIELLRRDCEILAGIARDHPHTLVTLHNAALNSDFPTANRLANEIGLREERFYAEGGGMWGWIIAAGVVFLAAAAFSGDSPPSPPPPPPDPPPAPVDAGAEGGADAGPG
jgi:hypothetical protein